MALTWDNVNAISRKYYVPKLVDNIFDSNAFFMRMKKKGKMPTYSGGTKIMQPIIYATNTSGGWYSGDANLTIDAVDTKTALEFNPKFGYQSITVLRTDILKNSGDAAVIDLVKAEFQVAERSMRDRFGTGLFSDGTDSESITGARVFCSTSSTYGGISQSTYSWLQSQVDSSSTTLTIPTLQTQFEAASEDNDMPTVAFTTGTLYNAYYGQLQPQQRFSDGDTARGGFKNILYNGIPVMIDSHVPANHWFFFNENYIDLRTHKDENFRFEPFLRVPQNNVNYAKIWWAGELVCSAPRYQALLSALTG